ncbi:MAG: hypothetical protein QNK36_10990 [Colwellia sp.]|nr:hypothetical protein [Colwellia sp.]
MKKEEFERLNTLSEKAMENIATPNEIEEFNKLFTVWNESAEYNLLQGFCTPDANE